MVQAEQYASALELQVVPGQEVSGSGGKLRVECLKCGNLSVKRYNALQSGKGCWWCGKARSAAKMQLPEKKLIEACFRLGHKFMSRSGTGKRTKVLYKCRFGAEHTQSQDSIVAQKGCGCAVTSSYEHAVRSRFEFATGYRWPRISKCELRELTGAKDAPKEIDLFCRELGISVEVDGGFHRPTKHESAGWHSKVYPRIIQADALRDAFVASHKDKLAKHSGLRPLIRINTDDLDGLSQDELNAFVKNILTAHRISIARDLNGFVPPLNISLNQCGTARNGEAAEAKGCRYPDQPYLGVNAKHRFECFIHGEFKMRAARMRSSDGGCPKCGQLRRLAAVAHRVSYLAFEECRQQVRDRGIRSNTHYKAVRKQNRGWPSSPSRVYDNWQGWRDFLGSGVRSA